MKNPNHKHRFGILLEAYCRGIGPNFKDLFKQVEAVEKLAGLSISIKSTTDNLNLIRVSLI